MPLSYRTLAAFLRPALLVLLLCAAGCPRPAGDSAGDAPAVDGKASAPAETAGVPRRDPGSAWSGDAQDFDIETLDGKKMKLSALAAGKPVVVDFWAVW